MGPRLLKTLPALLVLLLPGVTGCGEQPPDLSKERSPNALPQTAQKAPADAGSVKPITGFKTKQVGSDTSLKIVN
jgi:hypothetical protein